jgi:diaminopimelate epimerase
MEAQFYKYQALGNDMVVIDPAMFARPLTPTAVRLLCDRHLGLGADGICYGPLPGAKRPLTMRFFNPDGSEAQKSGNGLRIFARYVWDAGYVAADSAERPRNFTIAMGEEAIGVHVLDDGAHTISLDMGTLTFAWVEEAIMVDGEQVVVTAVSIGNPHCVVFTDHLSAVHTLGPHLETAPQFPDRTNVQFVHVLDAHTIQIEIWERGAGYTLASGTSSCAAAGAAIRTGRCHSPVEVRMAGGVAQVAVNEMWGVTLTGNVAAVCQGTLAADLLAQLP